MEVANPHAAERTLAGAEHGNGVTLPTLLPQNSKAQVALHEEGIVIVSLEVKSPLFCLTF
jgi:hypothetical protein